MEKKPMTIWNRNFICIMIAASFMNLSHWSVNPLVSKYAQYLGAGPVLMGLLTGMFFAIALAMRPVAGPAMTRLDHRKLLIADYALGGVVNLGYALFHNIPVFMVLRFFHGVQYSIMGSLCMVIAGDSLPYEKMASGMGVYGVGGSIMTAIGPTIGIWLQEYGTRVRDAGFGYSLDFLFAAAVLFVAIIPTALMKTEKRSKAETASAGKWYQTIFTVSALPMTVIMMLLIVGYSTFNAYMVPFAEGRGIANISIFFTVMAVVMLAVRPISGKLTDTFGYKRIMIPAIAVFAASFVTIGLASSLPVVLVGAVLAAIGYGAAQPALMAMCLQSVPVLKRGVASNTLYIGMDLGFFAGPLLGSVVYSVSDYPTMYLSMLVPVVAALVLFIVLWPLYVKRSREAYSVVQTEDVEV